MTIIVLCFAEEYVAHASNIQSLCLGQHSGRLLATGGEDCQINLWSLDKPNCQMVSCLDSFEIDFSTCIKREVPNMSDVYSVYSSLMSNVELLWS